MLERASGYVCCLGFDGVFSLFGFLWYIIFGFWVYFRVGGCGCGVGMFRLRSFCVGG